MYARLLWWLWEQYWGSSPPCEAFGPLIFHNTRSRNRDSMNNILSLIQIELGFNFGPQLLPWYPKLFGYCHVMHLALWEKERNVFTLQNWWLLSLLDKLAIAQAGEMQISIELLCQVVSWQKDEQMLRMVFIWFGLHISSNIDSAGFDSQIQSGFWLNCYFFNIDLQRFGDLRWELPGSPLLGPRHRNVPRARFGLNFCFQKCVFSF